MKSIVIATLMALFLIPLASFGEEPLQATMPHDAQHGQPKGPSVGVAKQKDSAEKNTGLKAVTIAEVFRKSAALDKKKVVVRGKVIKVSKGIMKRNWIHIQDGTGSASSKTDALVCTSKELPNIGDVVTAQGVLAKDRDFGSGYRYNAILEKVTFK